MLRHLKDMTDQSCEVTADICVVGAGPAGLAAAIELARHHKSVVVLESGPIDDADRLADLNKVEASSRHYQGPLTGRARTLGGTSSLWGGRLIPLTRHDMDARTEVGVPEWPVPYDELYAHTPAVEVLFGVARSGSYEEPPRFGSHGTVVADDHEVHCRAPKIVPVSHRNLYWTVEREIKSSRTMTLFAGATVVDIALDRDGGRACAVTATGIHGRTLKVRFDRLVLAAGTLETTRLLMLMDRKHEGKVFASCQALGKHFTDHIALDVGGVAHYDRKAVALLIGHARQGSVRRAIHFELAPAVQSARKIASAYLCLRLDIGDGPVSRLRSVIKQRQGILTRRNWTDLLASPADVSRAALWRAFHRQADLPDFIDIAAEIRIEQVPSQANQLRLSDDRDSLGLPRLQVDWDLQETERQTFTRSLQLYQQYWRRHDIARHCHIDWATFDPESALSSGQARDVFHPSGSTRMGTDPSLSVVGPDLSCHAVPNISVLSPSVFPSAGSVNPMLTLMALALRLASRLGQRPRP